MVKCIVCIQKKGFRSCPALNGKICSLCCGTKREKDIKCPASCEILVKSTEYWLNKNVRTEITDEIARHFPTKEKDIFKNSHALKFVEPLERSFHANFYNDKNVNDLDIRAALVKIYLYQTGKTTSLEPVNRCEQLVFEKYEKLVMKTANLSNETRRRCILRVLKSIRDTSGGALGNRNYLSMLHDQFAPSGTISYK